MVKRCARRLHGLLVTLLLAGCLHPVQEQVDHSLLEIADRPRDPEPPRPAATARPATSEVAPQRPADRLQIPPELPGADAAPIRLPDIREVEARRAAIDRLYPALPALGVDAELAPGPEGRPLTLSDLERLALTNSPLIRQAAAEVEAARGAAIQAGLYPNPIVGYASDTAGTGGTAGYQGGFVLQTIKTGGKLKLAQAAAEMELANARLALRRAENDLMTKVRAGYFAVLVAQENVRIGKVLTRFVDEAFQVQVDKVKAGPAAPYEPMQIRVLSFQARSALTQARNQHAAAWKQLASTLGTPTMPPAALAGRPDIPVPVFHQERVLAHVLSNHTDVVRAQNAVQKARYQLRLAQVTPVPDVDVKVTVQKDYTTAPFLVTHNLEIGLPVPLWDRNQGNILQAQANLLRATEEAQRVRAELTARLAEAFRRYDDNRQLLASYSEHILPDYVRIYRGVSQRFQEQPGEVNFFDIVNAQQALGTAVVTYVTTIGSLWSAVVDVADLLQTNDLFATGLVESGTTCLPAIPVLDSLPR